jgi:hypothetical protein
MMQMRIRRRHILTGIALAAVALIVLSGPAHVTARRSVQGAIHPRRIATMKPTEPPVRVSLGLPLQAHAWYWRLAILRLPVTVTNISRELAWIQGGDQFAECPDFLPGAQALDAHNHVLFPLKSWLGASCGNVFPRRSTPGFLNPGQSRRYSAYVVLQSSRVQPVVDVTMYAGCDPRVRSSCQGTRSTVTGAPVTMHLRRGPSWRMAVSGSPPSTARLVRIGGTRPKENDPLWVYGVYTCRTIKRDGIEEGGIGSIVPTPNATGIIPMHLTDCNSNHVQVHMVAGYVNQPIARLEYVRP